jgi:Xaa-Pro aminopeptidase
MEKGQIIKRRVRSIRRILGRKKISCLIVTKPANVTYITGFSGGDSWAVITNGFDKLTTRGGVYLLTDSRYTEQAKSECSGCRIIERRKPMVEAAAELVRKLKSVRAITVEKSTSLGDFEKLKEKVKGRVGSTAGIRLRVRPSQPLRRSGLSTIAASAEALIERLRSSKDDSEIAAIKKAAQIAAEALEKTLKHIKPNVTESELAGALDFEIRKIGAKNSFETIVAFGANASRPHHQPGTRKLKKNDTVLIDFGVRYRNYCCDLTRCFAVGKVNNFYRKVYSAVKEAQAAAIKMVKPGVEIEKVDAAARAVIRKYGLPVYGHGTGHGIGLEVHEEPVILEKSKGKLQAGMVFTIEPAVYIPGRLGVRIEDDVLVAENGCKVLSHGCPYPVFGKA